MFNGSIEAVFIQLRVPGTAERYMKKLLPFPSATTILSIHSPSPMLIDGVELDVWIRGKAASVIIFFDFTGTLAKLVQKYGVLLLTSMWIWLGMTLRGVLSTRLTSKNTSDCIALTL